jgi:hypothetical protein
LSTLTKVFIVLQLVCSLVLSVLLVFMVSKQEPYKNRLNDEVTKSAAYQAIAAKNDEQIATKDANFAAVSNQLKEAQAAAASAATDNALKMASLQTNLAKANADNAQLANNVSALTSTSTLQQNLIADMNKSLDDLRPKVATLTSENAQLNRLVNDLKNANDSAEQAIRKLQERIAQAEAAPKASAIGGTSAVNLSAQTNVVINGRITKATQSLGRTLIELSLGTRDGVQVSSRFAVYRDSNYVGDAVVERVSPDQAVAVVTLTKPGQSVQVGDLVMSGQ